jgi:hypothetical protein
MMDGFIKGTLLTLTLVFLITSRLRKIKIYYKTVFHVSAMGKPNNLDTTI